MLYRTAWLIPLLAAFWNLACAQPAGSAEKAIPFVGLKLHQGFLLIHSRDLRPMGDAYPFGVELDLAWHNPSQQAWNSCLCYPRLGFALSGWSFDNPEVLGYGLTGMFYLEPVFAAWRGVSYSLRAAFGLSYQSRPYHPDHNPDNLSYSTYVAFPLELGGSVHFRLSSRWRLDVSAMYNHISNGGIREPNKGINWPTAALGLSRYWRGPAFANRKKADWRAEGPPATRMDLGLFLAFQEPESKLYLLSPGMELKYSRQVSRISALTLGAEWLVDNQLRFNLERSGDEDAWSMGSLALGHEFLLGRTLFSQQFGLYVFKPHRSGTDVYQRYGLSYRLSGHFQAGIALKAHGHVADFLDLRVVYTLN